MRKQDSCLSFNKYGIFILRLRIIRSNPNDLHIGNEIGHYSVIIGYLIYSVIKNAILTLLFFILIVYKYFLKGSFSILKDQICFLTLPSFILKDQKYFLKGSFFILKDQIIFLTLPFFILKDQKYFLKGMFFILKDQIIFLTLPFFYLMDQKYFLKGMFFILKGQLSNRLSVITHFDLLDRVVSYMSFIRRTWGGKYI